jgi:uncharacterized protein with HEPN domain
MSVHDDSVRLRHMRDYAREVSQFTQSKTRLSLDSDILLERALRYNIGIIGEAASRVSSETRSIHPQIPWPQITGMRNYLFHVYFRVDNDVLWETATVSIPELLDQLDAILPLDDIDTSAQ